MSSLLARRAACLGLAMIGLRFLAWKGFGYRGSFIAPTDESLTLAQPAIPPTSLNVALDTQAFNFEYSDSSPTSLRDGLDVVFSSANTEAQPIVESTKHNHVDTQIFRAQADSAASPSSTPKHQYDSISVSGDNADSRRRRKRTRGGARHGKEVIDSAAMPADTSVPHNVHFSQQVRVSGSSGDTCDDERREQDALWAHARAQLYVDYNVTVNQPPSPGELPPLWRSSSVATGPDFECNEAIRAEQARAGGNLARPSWGACALLCGNSDCSHARRQCQQMPKQCRGVALMSDSKYKGLGVLKGNYVWTAVATPAQQPARKNGSPLPPAEGAVKQCIDLYTAARTGNGRNSGDARQVWMDLGCGDYSRPHWDVHALQQPIEQQQEHSRAESTAVPALEWGGLPEATTVASSECRACPTEQFEASQSGNGRSRGSRASSSSGSSSKDSILGPIHLIVVTDRPGSSLCAFLRTILWAQVDVTILSWAPDSPPRWQEWYLGSKPLVVANYLGRCLRNQQGGKGAVFGGGISANATVLVTDADVLFNAASEDELVSALLPFAPRIRSGEVIFSAEGPCVTVNVAYRKDLCAAFMRRASEATKGAPRLTALNSGLLVGQAWALRRLARRFVFAAKHYQSVVLKPTSYNLLQDRMRAAMAAADAVTEAVDYINPSWAAAAAASTRRGASSPVASSLAPHVREEVARAVASMAASRQGKDINKNDGGGDDDFSRLMQVRMRYRRDLAAGTLSKASASAGRLTNQGAGDTTGLPFLFNDQSVYYLMLSVEGQTSDGLGHGVTLDYKSELFLSMYGSPNRLELKIDRQPDRQRLVVLGAQKSSSEKSPLGLTAPLFVHYNGGAKLAKWNPEVSRSALHDTLRMAHRTRSKISRSSRSNDALFRDPLTGNEVQDLDVLFKRHVTVVDNHLRRVDGFAFSDICPR